MKRRSLIILATLIAFALPAAAQSAVSYNLRIYNKGATAPMSAPTSLASTAFLCGQAALTNGTVVNPTRIVFDDPTVVGKVCIYQDPGTGPLLSMPTIPAAYEATLTTVVDAGPETPESNRAPFARATTPANLKLAR